MTSANNSVDSRQRINKVRLVRVLLALPLYFALFMFLPAGTWAWMKGWLFILVFLGTVAIVSAYLWRVNPEVIVARTASHEGTKRWDKILLCFFFPAVYAIIPVAALDDGRFHWFPLPWWVCGIGYALFLAGMGLVTWAEAVNKFFEVTVRIQTDRGQTVIETGLYAVVTRRLRQRRGHLRGYCLGARFSVGVNSRWSGVGLAHCANALGRPNAAS